MGFRLKKEGWAVLVFAVIIYTICIPFVVVFTVLKEIFYAPLGIIKGYTVIWNEILRKYWY